MTRSPRARSAAFAAGCPPRRDPPLSSASSDTRPFAFLASSSETDAESALRRTKGPLIAAVICNRLTPPSLSRVNSPTATIAAGTRLNNKPPNAPQAANLGSDSSSNLRRRPPIPSTIEKSAPATKPGIASAGNGASKTSKNESHGRPGRSKLLTPIITPPTAHPIAHVIPIPTAPRRRLSHVFITNAPCAI